LERRRFFSARSGSFGFEPDLEPDLEELRDERFGATSWVSQ
jgi:hypothetical protein